MSHNSDFNRVLFQRQPEGRFGKRRYTFGLEFSHVSHLRHSQGTVSVFKIVSNDFGWFFLGHELPARLRHLVPREAEVVQLLNRRKIRLENI